MVNPINSEDIVSGVAYASSLGSAIMTADGTIDANREIVKPPPTVLVGFDAEP